MHRLDRISAKKPAKLLDSKSLTLGFSRKQIWPVFLCYPANWPSNNTIGAHTPVAPFERSGLAFGFGHRRFACGNLQANGLSDQVASDRNPARFPVFATLTLSRGYNSHPIAARLDSGIPSNGVGSKAARRSGLACVVGSAAPGRFRSNANVLQA